MPIVKYNPPKRPESTALATRSFESATAEIVARYHPFKERSVLFILMGLLATIILFVSVVKLDRLVVATGRIVPTEGALTVQPLDKAIIRRILVHVGEVVKKGQVLATCDPTFVHADLDAVREKVSSLGAQRRRMEAEEAGKPFPFDPSQAHDPLQSTIMKERSIEFTAGLNNLDQQILGSEAQIGGFKESIADLRARLEIAKETEAMYTKMEGAGIATRLDLIGVQDKTLDAANLLAVQQSQLDSAEHLLESLKEQRKVYVDKWHDDNLDKLTDVRDLYEQSVNDLTKAQKKSELVDLLAPVDAVVLQIPSLTLGGVATEAQPLFSLVPLDGPIEVDAQIDAQDSGFVKVGDKTTIKFDTFKFLEHGTGEGVVKAISQDSFTELDDQDTVTSSSQKQTRTPYFDARITVTGLHLHDVPADVRLIPGMTLEADIIVGRRTILWYLFGGAIKSGSDAMHEP
jgi:hemolysin D